MLKPRGAQLAHGAQSVAARSFYTALFRYANITCPVRQASRRGFADGGSDHGTADAGRLVEDSVRLSKETNRLKEVMDKARAESAARREAEIQAQVQGSEGRDEGDGLGAADYPEVVDRLKYLKERFRAESAERLHQFMEKEMPEPALRTTRVFVDKRYDHVNAGGELISGTGPEADLVKKEMAEKKAEFIKTFSEFQEFLVGSKDGNVELDWDKVVGRRLRARARITKTEVRYMVNDIMSLVVANPRLDRSTYESVDKILHRSPGTRIGFASDIAAAYNKAVVRFKHLYNHMESIMHDYHHDVVKSGFTKSPRENLIIKLKVKAEQRSIINEAQQSIPPTLSDTSVGEVGTTHPKISLGRPLQTDTAAHQVGIIKYLQIPPRRPLQTDTPAREIGIKVPMNSPWPLRNIPPSDASIYVHGVSSTGANEQATRARKIIDEPDSDLKTSIRSLMRSVTQPIAIVTTSVNRLPIGHPKPVTSKTISSLRGMTISSFTMITLDPEPIISFNIRTPSSTLDALANTRHFSIHFPRQSFKGRDLANAFVKNNLDREAQQSPFRTDRWTMTANTSPQSKGEVYLPMPIPYSTAIMSLRCEVLSGQSRHRDVPRDGLIQVGDHVIVLARVVAIEPTHNGRESAGNASVLCYEHGDYVATTSLKPQQKTKMMPDEYKRYAGAQNVIEEFKESQREVTERASENESSDVEGTFGADSEVTEGATENGLEGTAHAVDEKSSEVEEILSEDLEDESPGFLNADQIRERTSDQDDDDDAMYDLLIGGRKK